MICKLNGKDFLPLNDTWKVLQEEYNEKYILFFRDKFSENDPADMTDWIKVIKLHNLCSCFHLAAFLCILRIYYIKWHSYLNKINSSSDHNIDLNLVYHTFLWLCDLGMTLKGQRLFKNDLIMEFNWGRHNEMVCQISLKYIKIWRF